MDILKAFKKGYYFFEDRYYAVLDKINKFVPIYKAIDPIDKVAPSFVLFIALIAAVALMFLFVVSPPVAGAFNAAILVVDESGSPLEGVEINLFLGDKNKSLSTDDTGTAEVKIGAREVSATAVFSKEDFGDSVRSFTLSPDVPARISLSMPLGPVAALAQEIKIVFVNASTGSIVRGNVTASFTCSTPSAATPGPKETTSGEMLVLVPPNCGNMTATARADGFEPATVVLDSDPKYIRLTPSQADTTGELQVTVKDAGGLPVGDATVRVIDETTNTPADSGSTSQAGAVAFSSLQPGSYTVSVAAPDNRAAQRTGVAVTAGETAAVTLTLPAAQTGKKILLQLVEQGTTNNVANATVFIYQNNILLDSKLSDTRGIAEKFVGGDGNYLLVIVHPDYATKVEPNFPAKEASDNTPVAVVLAKVTASPPNSAGITVTAADEENKAVAGASVWVYDSRYPTIPLNYPAKTTAADGKAGFYNLLPAAYFAKARDSTGTAEGVSEEKQVAAGETAFLTVKVVTGEGTVEVTVVDAESDPAEKTMIAGAVVQFINLVDGNILSSCITNAEGKCESRPIKSDKYVYVRASKDGFVTTLADREIDIVNGKVRVDIGLWHDFSIGTGKKIDTRFLYFCNDWDCKTKPAKIESSAAGATFYYGKFELILADANEYSGIVQHVRVGLNSNLQLPLDYKLKINSARAPGGTAVLSKCWDSAPAKYFDDPGGCQAPNDAKVVNLRYGNFSGKIILPVTVEFVVQPNLAPGTEMRFYYRAKAAEGAAAIMSEEKLKLFKIGEIFCPEAGIAWSFKAKGAGEPDSKFASVSLDPRARPFDLNNNGEYDLHYWAYNCSGRDYASAALSAANGEPNAISFSAGADNFGPVNVLPFATVPFPSDTEISSDTEILSEMFGALKVFPRYETGTSATRLDFNLSVGQSVSGSWASPRFSVSASRRLAVLGLPAKLSDVGKPQITGKVVDYANQGLAVAGAFVKMAIPAPLSQNIEADNGGRSGSDGIFRFTDLPTLGGVEKITIEIRKAGYATFTVDIPVGHMAVAAPKDYGCISFDAGSVSVERSAGTSANFKVKTNDCNDTVYVKLVSELVILNGAAKMNENRDAEFTIGGTEEKSLAVKAEKSPLTNEEGLGVGEYFVHLYAHFSSDQGGFKGPIAKIRVFVSDTTSGLCFRMADPAAPGDPAKTKTTFDISGGMDSGLVVNSCFEFIEDLELPGISKGNVHAPNEEIFSLQYGLPPIVPGEVTARNMTFNRNLKTGEPAVVPIATGGGFVNLNWVDVFMTDKKHNGGASHMIWAHYFKGESDWANVTGFVPYTPANDSGPAVVDNAGWIDIDTYYPPDLVSGKDVETKLTTDSIWQGQHNVCGKNLSDAQRPAGECAVDEYFSGNSVQPYWAGMKADSIRVESDSGDENTLLGSVQWEYVNNDPNHHGLIDFNIVNNSLAGETYALIKVEDSIKGSGPVSVAVPFTWALAETGKKTWFEDFNQLAKNTDPPQILPDQRMLGVSMLASASPKVREYSYNDQNLALLLSQMGNAPDQNMSLAEVAFIVKVKSPAGVQAPSNEQKLLLKYYVEGTGGGWEESGPYQIVNGAGEFGAESVVVISLGDDAPPIRAIALVNAGSDGNNLEITGIWLRVKKTLVDTRNSSGAGSIPEGQTIATFLPNRALNPLDYNEMNYTISTSTPGVLVYFEDTTISSTTSPDASAIATTSSIGVQKKIGSELFHIRLTGAVQKECMGYNGLSGQTGYIAKPRVLLDWDWNTVTIGTCDADNPNYIYCDPAQFSIELTKRLNEIKKLAEQDVIGNSAKIQLLQWFKAYLIEDTFSSDFRDDFAAYYTSSAFGVPLQGLRDGGSDWGGYFKDGSRLVFLPEVVEAGLYEVFLDMQFDHGQYMFFYDSGGNIDLTATITVKLQKRLGPAVDSPFYHLGFNGNVGLQPDGTLHRNGYGAAFSNLNGPVVLTAGAAKEFVATESGSGAKTVSTEKVTGFEPINLTEKGLVFDIAKNLSHFKFSPSFATPVLMAFLAPAAGGTVESYYYLTDAQSGATIASPAGGYMNFWTGVGSSMGSRPFGCTDFSGNRLPFRWQDSTAQSGSCAVAANKLNSYGFRFPASQPGQQLYYESIFFVPFGQNLNLHSTCGAGRFYSPAEDTGSSGLVTLSRQELSKSISSLQDILNLVGAGYVCVSPSAESVQFWWNPQRLSADLNAVKQRVSSNGWDSGLACTISESTGGTVI